MHVPHDGDDTGWWAGRYRVIHDEHGLKMGQREVQKRTKSESESRSDSLSHKARLVIVRMKRSSPSGVWQSTEKHEEMARWVES